MRLQYCKEYTRCSSLDVTFSSGKNNKNIKQQQTTQDSSLGPFLRLNETTVFHGGNQQNPVGSISVVGNEKTKRG